MPLIPSRFPGKPITQKKYPHRDYTVSRPKQLCQTGRSQDKQAHAHAHAHLNQATKKGTRKRMRVPWFLIRESVEMRGLEPLTPALQRQCSQLSYIPKASYQAGGDRPQEFPEACYL